MVDTNESLAITSHLTDVTSDRGVELVAARDHGSRARGLAGPDSDYDVMFIYMNTGEQYMTGRERDTIDVSIPASENSLDTEIELHGWSLRKFLGGDGVLGSNPTALEFIASDEDYCTRYNEHIGGALAQLCTHVEESFKPYALINHYRSMAASNYGKYVEDDYKITAGDDELLDYVNVRRKWDDLRPSLDEQETGFTPGGHVEVVARQERVKRRTLHIADAIDKGWVEPTTQDPTVKRHLAILQALTKARYVEETHELPPMDSNGFLHDIAEEDWLPEHVYASFGKLIMLKKQGNGDNNYGDDELHDWIESELSRDVEPQGHVERQPDSELVKTLGEEISVKMVIA